MNNWAEWEYAKAEGCEPQSAKYLNFGDDNSKSSSTSNAKAKVDDYSKGYKSALADNGLEDDDYDDEQPSVLESIRQRSNERKEAKESPFTSLDKTIATAKVEGALNGGIDGELTIFAPDDSAFRSLSAKSRKKLDDEDLATMFIKGHTVEGTIDIESVQGSSEMYASGSITSTTAPAVYEGLSLTVTPPRVSQKDLPKGMIAEEPIVQLIDNDTGKILHQANIKYANHIPGKGVIYEIDDVLVPRN